MIQFAPFISISGWEENASYVHEVIWTFSKNLKGVGNVRQRFNIHLIDNIQEERKFTDSGIKSIFIYYDLQRLNGLSLPDKKKQLLNLIRDAFLAISADMNWDPQKIKDAVQLCRNDELIFLYKSEYKCNPSKKLKGRIQLTLKEDKVSINAQILEISSHHSIEYHLLDTHEYHVSFFRRFNEWGWLDENRFGFRFGKSLELSVDLNEGLPVWKNALTNEQKQFIKMLNYMA